MTWRWLLGSLLVFGCGDDTIESAAGLQPRQSTSRGARELIPAEWTVFEDTAPSGNVTTASMQLPAARDIEGLGEQDTPRLVLRCIEGKIEMSIATAVADTLEPLSTPIQLDSAPVCE